MTNVSRCCYRNVVFVALLIVLSIAAPTPTIHAQDPPPTDVPTSTPAPTDTATATATWTPLPAPTNTPTATDAPTATDTPTLTETPSPIETATLAEMTPEVTETVVPSETDTETATPTSTENLTETVTPISSNVEWVQLTNPNAGLRNNWLLPDKWERIPAGEGNTIHVFDDGIPATLRYNHLRNVAIQARIYLMNGVFTFGIRRSGSGGYTVSLDESGTLRLLKDDVELATQAVATPLDAWHTIYLYVSEDEVHVGFDGVEVITIQDNAPFPAGAVTMGGYPIAGSSYWVGEVGVWLAQPEYDALAQEQAQSAAGSQSSTRQSSQITGGFSSRLEYKSCDEECGIRILNPDGTTSVYNHVGFFANDAWAPDGRRIALSERIGSSTIGWKSTTVISALDPDTGSVTRLSDSAAQGSSISGGFADHCPSWSPDGSRVVFLSSYRDGTYSSGGSTYIHNANYVVDSEGSSAPIRLALSAVNRAIQCPLWRPIPGSTEIAYTQSNGDGTLTLYLVDADQPGAGSVPIFSFGHIRNPAWSADGSKLAFSGGNNTSQYHIYVYSFATDEIIQLTDDPDYNDYSLSWSPDNIHIAYDSWGVDGRHIAIASVNQPCPNCVRQVVSGSAVYDEDPQWSPDGNWIAVWSWRDEPASPDPNVDYSEIYVLALDGSDAQRITTNTSFDCCPIWEPLPQTCPAAVTTTLTTQQSISEECPVPGLYIEKFMEDDNGIAVIGGLPIPIVDDPNDGQSDGVHDVVTSVTAGDLITITLQITNTSGEMATNIQAQEVLPPYVIYQSHNETEADYTPATGIWNIPSLPDKSTQPEGATLEIIAQVAPELGIEQYVVNTATIITYEPSTIELIVSEDVKEVVTVECEGWVNTNKPPATTRLSPSILADPIGNPLNNGTEGAILEYVITSDNISSLTQEERTQYQYGWFRLTNRRNYSSSSPRYIAAALVQGCDELTYPFYPNVFDENQIISAGLDDPLPAPPPGSNVESIVCTNIARELARRECAAQVYISFYEEFQSRFGRPPTVRDLIGVYLSLELYPNSTRTLAPPELLAATAVNVYYGTCVESSMNIAPCDGYDVIDFLQASDGWIQIGGNGAIDPIRPEELFTNFNGPEVQANLPINDPLTGFVTYNDKTPIAWGNYYFGTDGFNQFTTNNDPTLLHCERIQGYDSNGNPFEYLFVITNTTSNPLTNYEGIGTPAWYLNGQAPNSLQPC